MFLVIQVTVSTIMSTNYNRVDLYFQLRMINQFWTHRKNRVVHKK